MSPWHGVGAHPILPVEALNCRTMPQFSPETKKQKEAGFMKKRTPLLRAIMMHVQPIAIMKKLIWARTAVVMFRPGYKRRVPQRYRSASTGGRTGHADGGRQGRARQWLTFRGRPLKNNGILSQSEESEVCTVWFWNKKRVRYVFGCS